MASSRKPRSADPVRAADAFLGELPLKNKRLVAGLSGGMDSVVLLHVLARLRGRHGYRLSALHVHHGLSANAAAWARFSSGLCKSLKIPLRVRRVRVTRAGSGLEAAARAARYAAFRAVQCDAIVLAHHLDDQAETVLFNLLRGTGARGLSGMPARSALDSKLLLRPFLGLRRAALHGYALEQGLRWVEDESNADEALTRSYLRQRVAPVIESRFPRWREALARAARLASRKEADASDFLREFLRAQGLRAPSEAKLGEMLKQLGSAGPRTAIAHDGKVLRKYRDRLLVEDSPVATAFDPVPWRGESRIDLPSLGGTLTFKPALRAPGIDAGLLKEKRFSIRLRRGGERLQTDAKRPRRTLKNLFQEAGIPPHERDRLPLLFCGEELAWVPGIGVDVRFQARGRSGRVPDWQSKALFLRKSAVARGKIAR